MDINRLFAQRLVRIDQTRTRPAALRCVIAFGQLVLLFVTIHAVSHAQSGACAATPLRVDEAVGSLHAKNYPMTTQDKTELEIVTSKERVSGVAVLQVDVDTNGNVIAAVPLDGPRQLTDLFKYEAKRITFYPFRENGQPVCVRFSLRYAAGLGQADSADAKIEAKLIPLFNKCSALSAAKAGPEAVNQCRLAAEAADKLTTMGNNKNRVAAYTNYASTLILENRSKEALAYAQKAVAACDLGFIDISDKAVAYSLRGQVFGLTGDPHGADNDLAKAEELERATLEVPRTPEQRKFDSGVLRSVLTFHAQILEGLGETAEADKLRDEARKL
jgi:tetratricopeptide (TPR) repeat protein